MASKREAKMMDKIHRVYEYANGRDLYTKKKWTAIENTNQTTRKSRPVVTARNTNDRRPRLWASVPTYFGKDTAT